VSIINTDWTNDKIAQLKHLFDQGVSVSNIASQLALTRNAVLGKIHRLGLSKKRDKQRLKGGRAGKLVRDRKRAQAQLTFGPSNPLPPPHPADLDIPHSQRRQLLELNWNECRYPIGDPGVDLFFCGAPKSETDRSYCTHHRAIVWVKPRRAY
jgi:GcrA cell cycle regulator